MPFRIRAFIYLALLIILISYVVFRMVADGARPGCGVVAFVVLFAAAGLTNLIRAKAAEPPGSGR